MQSLSMSCRWNSVTHLTGSRLARRASIHCLQSRDFNDARNSEWGRKWKAEWMRWRKAHSVLVIIINGISQIILKLWLKTYFEATMNFESKVSLIQCPTNCEIWSSILELWPKIYFVRSQWPGPFTFDNHILINSSLSPRVWEGVCSWSKGLRHRTSLVQICPGSFVCHPTSFYINFLSPL